jgi:hypothetical protein
VPEPRPEVRWTNTELARIYQDLGRTDDAHTELQKFLEMWKDADADMPQLIDARERLERLEAGEV